MLDAKITQTAVIVNKPKFVHNTFIYKFLNTQKKIKIKQALLSFLSCRYKFSLLNITIIRVMIFFAQN